MSITKVTDAGLDRNRIVTPLIINGDMSIAQRGTSETGVGTAQVFVTDRFRNQPVYGSTAPTARFTITQSTTVPTGQGFFNSLKWDCTTAQGSLTSDTGFTIEQRLEGQNVQSIKKGTSNAEKLTMAFWVRSNKTGTYICELVDNDNTRHCSKSYTISSADTWEKKVINFPADTTGAFGNDNALSLKLRIWLAAGSDFTGGTLATSFASVTNANTAVGQVNLADSTDNEFYLTGVQMEVGEFDSTSIPSFPFESFENNLRKCQRYFQSLGVNGAMDVSATSDGKRLLQGQRDNSGNASAQVICPVITPLRTNPSVTTNQVNCRQDGTSTDLNSIAVAFRGNILQVTVTNTSDFNTGDSMQLRCTGTNSYIRFDAEL